MPLILSTVESLMLKRLLIFFSFFQNFWKQRATLLSEIFKISCDISTCTGSRIVDTFQFGGTYLIKPIIAEFLMQQLHLCFYRKDMIEM